MVKIKNAKVICARIHRNALRTHRILIVHLCARSNRTWLHNWRVVGHRLRSWMSEWCLGTKVAMRTLVARVVSDCLATALCSQEV